MPIQYRGKNNKGASTPVFTYTGLYTNNSRNPSPTPLSELSSLSSDSEYKDLVENQPTAQPRDGQLITSNQWVPIATSGVSSNTKRNKKIRVNKEMAGTSPPNNNSETLNSNPSTQSVPPPLNAFAELESSLPPLPVGERTYSPQEPIDFNQGVSPKDVNQYATSLALASSRSTPVPPQDERFRWDRPRTSTPALIPIPAEMNQPERQSTEQPFRQSTGEPSFVYGRGTLYPSLRHRHQHARPAMELVPKGPTSTERPLNEDGFTASHFHARSSHESRGPRGDAQSQPTVDSARRDGPLGAISPEQHDARYHDSSVDTGRAMVMSTPHLPGVNQPSSVPNHISQRPAPHVTHHVQRQNPPNPPFTTHQEYQNQTVAIRPAMAPPIHVNQQHPPPYANQQPYYQNPPPNGQHPQQRGPNRAPGRRRPDATVRMVRMGESFARVERVLGRMNRFKDILNNKETTPINHLRITATNFSLE
ncbi:hypothetical protein KEM48_011927 [Puccinia striiformis f. sp. tritici PST-130]|nr:hypothetical protein KEM48_011927 [Puccinia striiformis f. sp. tritici PST-130]